MRIDDLDYHLPEALIATHPVERRDHARLLTLTESGPIDRRFDELPALLPEGALVVVNDTRVIPARLVGSKAETGGRFELLLVQKIDRISATAERWLAMAKSSKRIRLGTEVRFSDTLEATIEAGPDERGLFMVALRTQPGRRIDELVESEGRVPLPPYLGREEEPADRQRYQTMFARNPGAVAAPTAGLHFTREVLARLEERGCSVARVTLHVGPGTFKPVKVAELGDHPMHRERFVVGTEAARAVERARSMGAPVVAVGTTVVRALECVLKQVKDVGFAPDDVLVYRSGRGLSETQLKDLRDNEVRAAAPRIFVFSPIIPCSRFITRSPKSSGRSTPCSEATTRSPTSPTRE